MVALPVRFPASLAVIVMTLIPGASGTAPVQVVVPDAAPLPPAAFDHVTPVTPTLSHAVPPRLTDEDVVLQLAAVVGDVMAMPGDVVLTMSTLKSSGNEVAGMPVLSKATAVQLWSPLF